MIEKEKGCVYFFKHVGLSPIKIGFSTNESPLSRFDQFRTYAPFGAELVGFIRTYEPLELETILHAKYALKRLKGEWFDITYTDVEREIELYSNISDIQEMNNFQIEWSRKVNRNKVDIENDRIKEMNHYDATKEFYIKDKDFNRTDLAERLGVSRATIIRNIRKINKIEMV